VVAAGLPPSVSAISAVGLVGVMSRGAKWKGQRGPGVSYASFKTGSRAIAIAATTRVHCVPGGAMGLYNGRVRAMGLGCELKKKLSVRKIFRTYVTLALNGLERHYENSNCMQLEER
jgi:hypothetical protein